MKRAIYLIIAISVIAILIYWFNANADKANSSISIADRNFKVENIDEVQTIFIADTKGTSDLLSKRSDGWYLNDSFLVNDLIMANLLSTFKNIQLQFIPPNKAREKILDQFGQIGLKIELYNKNKEALKRFYIGGSTSDERGTYFLMEGSNQPYVMELPAFEGSLRGRFVVDKELWRDKTIFKATPSQIARISVNYPKKRDESFVLEKKLLSYDLSPYFEDQLAYDGKLNKDKIDLYLEEFDELIAEAFENNHPRKDSIVRLIPFAEVELLMNDGSINKISLFPYDDIYRGAVTESLNQAQTSIRRYFIKSNSGDFMLIQHNVFKGILRGYAYFYE